MNAETQYVEDKKEDDEGVRKEVEVRVGIKGSHRDASSVLTLSPGRSVDRLIGEGTDVIRVSSSIVSRLAEKKRRTGERNRREIKKSGKKERGECLEDPAGVRHIQQSGGTVFTTRSSHLVGDRPTGERPISRSASDLDRPPRRSRSPRFLSISNRRNNGLP